MLHTVFYDATTKHRSVHRPWIAWICVEQHRRLQICEWFGDRGNGGRGGGEGRTTEFQTHFISLSFFMALDTAEMSQMKSSLAKSSIIISIAGWFHVIISRIEICDRLAVFCCSYSPIVVDVVCWMVLSDSGFKNQSDDDDYINAHQCFFFKYAKLRSVTHLY